jgi:hypothetical protein
MEVYHMETSIRAHTEEGALADYQAVRRSAGEAARLKAAHRYFQRTATRRPFRKEACEEPAGTFF